MTVSTSQGSCRLAPAGGAVAKVTRQLTLLPSADSAARELGDRGLRARAALARGDVVELGLEAPAGAEEHAFDGRA